MGHRSPRRDVELGQDVGDVAPGGAGTDEERLGGSGMEPLGSSRRNTSRSRAGQPIPRVRCGRAAFGVDHRPRPPRDGLGLGHGLRPSRQRPARRPRRGERAPRSGSACARAAARSKTSRSGERNRRSRPIASRSRHRRAKVERAAGSGQLAAASVATSARQWARPSRLAPPTARLPGSRSVASRPRRMVFLLAREQPQPSAARLRRPRYPRLRDCRARASSHSAAARGLLTLSPGYHPARG